MIIYGVPFFITGILIKSLINNINSNFRTKNAFGNIEGNILTVFLYVITLFTKLVPFGGWNLNLKNLNHIS